LLFFGWLRFSGNTFLFAASSSMLIVALLRHPAVSFVEWKQRGSERVGPAKTLTSKEVSYIGLQLELP
jgi:hypothetical protein